MNAEFFDALDEIEKEKGIPKSYMLDKIKQALLAAMKKDNPDIADNLTVNIDQVNKKIEMYVQKTVVEQVENPALEMLLEEAKLISATADSGDIVSIAVDTEKFGRIAAQAGKQVIIQGIREAERGIIFEEFTSKENEILTGVITRVEPRNGDVSVKIGSNSEVTETVLRGADRVPNEEYREGDRIKVYVSEVRRSTKGPQVIISRTHPGLVKRLFELEVPEIFDGIVEIKSVSREAGSRTKIAVYSNDSQVDATGACIGPKGGRVTAIVNELHGEKIDIISYSDDPGEYVAAALQPADVISVSTDVKKQSCTVIVPNDQLSLAIGKEGQNARLAARLTGYKIDIKPEKRAGDTQQEQEPEPEPQPVPETQAHSL